MAAAPVVLAQVQPPPHAGVAAAEGFQQYLAAPSAKAFVVGPGGAWAWRSGFGSAVDAETEALASCQEHVARCFPYARDARRVLDESAWAQAWRPYPSKSAAADRPVGLLAGARFPDVTFVAPDGRKRRVSDYRGQAVVLHFWGSWCGPCRHELPDMVRALEALKGERVQFIPLQVRESVAASRAWLAQKKISMPVFDSGMTSMETGDLRLHGGGRLTVRAVAPVFPSTVFLDRQGVVLLSHRGPIERWSDYLPQLRDVARHAP